MGTLLLNSRGLNTRAGAEMIYHRLQDLKVGDLDTKTIYAVSFPGYAVDPVIIRNCLEIMGMRKENIHMSCDGIPDDRIPDLIYVTEGNIFEILKYMRTEGIVDYIRRSFQANPGTIYIGSSAGAMISGTDIRLALDFDANHAAITDYTALGLFDGTIIPHYEPEELKRYISNSEKAWLRPYRKIYSVGNDETVIIKT